MVPAIDLKPLSDEAIAEMGYGPHDLWIVKLDSIVFGPYETETLRHYVSENEHLFDGAEASLSDEKDWKPFWEHTKFQRRKLAAVSGEIHNGPFWLMDVGLIIGPFSFNDIDKKLEMGLLVMTDHLSTDEGQSWIKVFEINGFDRRTHNADDLPLAPNEASFQKAKLVLTERIEAPHLKAPEELAELAWCGQQQAKVLQLKIDELTLQQQNNPEVSSAMKWGIPTAAAIVLTLAATGYYAFHSTPDEAAVADLEIQEKTPSRKKTARGVMTGGVHRLPASTGYSQGKQLQYEPSKYPTYTETHDQHYEDPNQNADPIETPLNEMERPQEHSLVGSPNQNPENSSLDAAMNGMDQVEQAPPVVEEASEF